MLCKNPFVRDPSGKILKVSLLSGNPDLAVNGVPFPCGQCLACRINKRRAWTHRLLLEAMDHESSCFITLTYSDEYLPEGRTLRKKDLRDFFKRLRYYAGLEKLRYYACGEYGEETHRPHYHAIVFGLDLLDGEKVARAWPFGRVQVAECNESTVQYVAGYVTKKFVKRENDDGLVPEFAVMSRRPGIGYSAVKKLAALITHPKYRHLFQGDTTIPRALRHHGKLLPLDRFMRDKLCLILEHDAGCRQYILELTSRYFKASRELPDSVQPLVDSLIAESAQRNVQIHAKAKIYNHRNKI